MEWEKGDDDGARVPNLNARIFCVGIYRKSRRPTSRTSGGNSSLLLVTDVDPKSSVVDGLDGLPPPATVLPSLLPKNANETQKMSARSLLIPLVRCGRWPSGRQAGGMLNNSVCRIPWTDATPRCRARGADDEGRKNKIQQKRRKKGHSVRFSSAPRPK